MVRHNNRIVKNHFRYHWHPEASQKGHVKVLLGQAKAAERRKRKRKLKARAVFPRPSSGPLRPVGRCETIRYNMKRRLGRGFTFEELKAIGLSGKYARTIGISVDHRRTNKSEESLTENLNRLKKYLSKLVVFPLKISKKIQSWKKGAKKRLILEGRKKHLRVIQDTSRNMCKSMPLPGPAPREAPRELKPEEKSRQIFKYLRKCYRDKYLAGVREVRAKMKEKAKEEKSIKRKN